MAVLIAPVAYHRTLFQRGHKAEVVVAAHQLLRVGLAVLVAAVVGCLLLVVDEAVGRVAGLVVGGGSLAVFAALWFVLPVLSLHRGTSPPMDCGPLA